MISIFGTERKKTAMPALSSSSSSSSSSVPLIKGYLPIRLRLPRQPQLLRRGGCDDDDGGENTEDTFFFVREHQGRAADDSEATAATPTSLEAAAAATTTTTTTSKRGTTLFVANAPIVPGVSTKLLLKSIFGRFADVIRVTAVQNPRAAAKAAAAAENDDDETTTATTTTTTTVSLSTTSSLLAWSDKQAMFQPTFLPDILSETEGKYAHVVFSSAKEMKKAKKELEELMSDSAKGRNTAKKGMHDKNCNNNNNNSVRWFSTSSNCKPCRTRVCDYGKKPFERR